MERFGMPVGYHSLSWNWGQGLFTAISDLSALGYAGTESFADIARWDDFRLLDLEEHLSSHRMTLASLYYDGALGHPGHRSLHVANAEKAAALLERLGGTTLVVGGGWQQGLPQELEEMAKTLDAMAQAAWPHAVTLALHPHQGCLVYDEQSIEKVLSLTDPKAVLLCPDTAHLALAGMDPAQVVKRHAGRIGYVHLKDYASGEFRPLGEGQLDIPRVLGTLAYSGYKGWVMVEYDGQSRQAEHASRALEALRA